MTKKIEWYGSPGHFICGQWCRFHLCTSVGGYLVSTVGKFVHPRHSAGSEQAEAAWLAENPDGEDIGYKRKYETMVFKAGPRCKAKGCSCGMPTIVGQEIEVAPYNDAGAATRGHSKLVAKYAVGGGK